MPTRPQSLQGFLYRREHRDPQQALTQVDLANIDRASASSSPFPGSKLHRHARHHQSMHSPARRKPIPQPDPFETDVSAIDSTEPSVAGHESFAAAAPDLASAAAAEPAAALTESIESFSHGREHEELLQWAQQQGQKGLDEFQGMDAEGDAMATQPNTTTKLAATPIAPPAWETVYTSSGEASASSVAEPQVLKTEDAEEAGQYLASHASSVAGQPLQQALDTTPTAHHHRQPILTPQARPPRFPLSRVHRPDQAKSENLAPGGSTRSSGEGSNGHGKHPDTYGVDDQMIQDASIANGALNDDALSLDLDASELEATSLAELQAAPFERDARTASLELPSEMQELNLEARLEYLRDLQQQSVNSSGKMSAANDFLPPDLPARFFASLSLDEYDQCGALIVGQLASVVQRLSSVRRQKRDVARELEQAITAHAETVQQKQEALEKDMERLKTMGRSMIRGEASA